MKKNDLPKKISIFPLSNAIFFPRTILPLNSFEERYIKLVEDGMKENRLFGMVQPKLKIKQKPEVYKVGCLGKIISFTETIDKIFQISLSGVIRFKIIEELNTNKLYREFKVDYSDFINDLEEKKYEEKFSKKNLINKIKTFLIKKNYIIEFDKLEKLNFDQLINTICMLGPFSDSEKQKLIETIKIEEKVKILEKLIEFNVISYTETKQTIN